MNPDRAAVEPALEAFLVELGRIQDTLTGRSRAEGVSERAWGLKYLREIVDDIERSSLRSLLDSPLLGLGAGAGRVRMLVYPSHIRALLAAFDLATALYADEITAVPADLSTQPCRTCGVASPRRYCETCAREIGVYELENPLHGQQPQAA